MENEVKVKLTHGLSALEESKETKLTKTFTAAAHKKETLSQPSTNERCKVARETLQF